MVDLGYAVAAARAAAESLMVDACVIERETAEHGEWNEDSGDYDPAPTQAVYAGPCQVQAPDYAVQDAAAGERIVALQQITVKLPVASSAGVRIDDLVRVTRATYDPDLEGRTFTVLGLHHKTYASSRRLRCSEEAG